MACSRKSNEKKYLSLKYPKNNAIVIFNELEFLFKINELVEIYLILSAFIEENDKKEYFQEEIKQLKDLNEYLKNIIYNMQNDIVVSTDMLVELKQQLGQFKTLDFIFEKSNHGEKIHQYNSMFSLEDVKNNLSSLLKTLEPVNQLNNYLYKLDSSHPYLEKMNIISDRLYPLNHFIRYVTNYNQSHPESNLFLFVYGSSVIKSIFGDVLDSHVDFDLVSNCPENILKKFFSIEQSQYKSNLINLSFYPSSLKVSIWVEPLGIQSEKLKSNDISMHSLHYDIVNHQLFYFNPLAIYDIENRTIRLQIKDGLQPRERYLSRFENGKEEGYKAIIRVIYNLLNYKGTLSVDDKNYFVTAISHIKEKVLIKKEENFLIPGVFLYYFKKKLFSPKHAINCFKLFMQEDFKSLGVINLFFASNESSLKSLEKNRQQIIRKLEESKASFDQHHNLDIHFIEIVGTILFFSFPTLYLFNIIEMQKEIFPPLDEHKWSLIRSHMVKIKLSDNQNQMSDLLPSHSFLSSNQIPDNNRLPAVSKNRNPNLLMNTN